MKKWSRNYNNCVRCKRTDRPHWGHGLCRNCREILPARKLKFKRNQGGKIRFAMKRHGLKKEDVFQVLTRGKCFYCERLLNITDGRTAQIDHKIPGINKLENLVLACFNCNRMKGDNTVTTLINFLQKITNKNVQII